MESRFDLKSHWKFQFYTNWKSILIIMLLAVPLMNFVKNSVNQISLPCTKCERQKRKSMINKLGRYFWSQCNCDLISGSNIGFFFDVTNSIIDAIKILIICLHNNNPVTSFSSLLHHIWVYGLFRKEGVHLSIWKILAKFFGGKACGAT